MVVLDQRTIARCTSICLATSTPGRDAIERCEPRRVATSSATEHIDKEMRKLFGRLHKGVLRAPASSDDFVEMAAEFLAELSAIHAFREGNERAQLAFLRLISARARHPFDLTKLRHGPFMEAMIKSFEGATESLEAELRRLL